MITKKILEEAGFTDRYKDGEVYVLDSDDWSVRVDFSDSNYIYAYPKSDCRAEINPNIEDLFNLVYEQGKQAGKAETKRELRDLFEHERNHSEY